MLLVDTGVFVAAADDNDPDHDACVDMFASSNEEVVTTALVVAEAGYLIERQLGAAAEAAFFRSLANGDARVEPLTESDFDRTTPTPSISSRRVPRRATGRSTNRGPRRGT